MSLAIPAGRRKQGAAGLLSVLLDPPWRLHAWTGAIAALALAGLLWRGTLAPASSLTLLLAGSAVLGLPLLGFAVHRAAALAGSGGEGRVFFVGLAALSLVGPGLSVLGIRLGVGTLAAGLLALALAALIAARALRGQLRRAPRRPALAARLLPWLGVALAADLLLAAAGFLRWSGAWIGLAAEIMQWLVPLLALATALLAWQSRPIIERSKAA
jgi:hypothetical protein